MRRTTELNADVRHVPAGEVWVGVIGADRPYIAVATRRHDDDEAVMLMRLSSSDARDLAVELVRLAAAIEAPQN